MKNIQTDVTSTINIAVINSGPKDYLPDLSNPPNSKRDLGWFERIVRGEMDVKKEHATSIRGVIRSH